MNASQNKLPSRERRVWTMMWRMLAYALAVALAALVVSVLRSRAQGDSLSLLSGMTTGMLLLLPFGMAFLLYHAYRQMDEYGQRLQEKASSFAFVMTMLAASAGFVLAHSLKISVPLWTLYLFGMAAYTASWPERTPMRTPGRRHDSWLAGGAGRA